MINASPKPMAELMKKALRQFRFFLVCFCPVCTASAVAAFATETLSCKAETTRLLAPASSLLTSIALFLSALIAFRLSIVVFLAFTTSLHSKF